MINFFYIEKSTQKRHYKYTNRKKPDTGKIENRS